MRGVLPLIPALLIGAGCHPAPPTNGGENAVPPGDAATDPGPDPAPDAPAPPVCEAAREGQPCEGHGYCVLDWGDPGGWSSALWCRDGRWEREEERNLEE